MKIYIVFKLIDTHEEIQKIFKEKTKAIEEVIRLKEDGDGDWYFLDEFEVE